jgi:hypothetical protein
VVNISASGALVEGLTRLLPNTHTDVHIVTRSGRVLVRARVVRAVVWQLQRDMVCYRTALAFDTPVDTDAAAAPAELSASGAPAFSEGGESNGPALSEHPARQGANERESNGYHVPREIPRKVSAPGTLYPTAEVEHRG